VQAESIVAALERFFLDIVGTVVPGGAALLAAAVLFGGTIDIGPVSLTPSAATFNLDRVHFRIICGRPRGQ